MIVVVTVPMPVGMVISVGAVMPVPVGVRMGVLLRL